MAEQILLAVLGGGNIILFLKFLIERYDRKMERKEDKEAENIKGTLKKLEKDGLRTQLLLLLLMMPDEKKEIMTVAEHYFVKPPAGLGGNWYMTSLFDKWLTGHNSGVRPEWFNKE